jgi:Right handed beta helix region
MRRIALLALLVGLIPLVASAPAHAQATRTWVSGVGDDANPCSRTAPCKTFAGAISKTQAGGEINCLDPGGFGTVTITKAMTLNCKETGIGSILAAGAPGITINAGAADRVTLRSLQIQGVNQTPTPGTIGVRILSAAMVSIEDCVITAFGQAGISDARTAGSTKLYIRNSVISNNTSSGVSLIATALNNVEIDGSSMINNLFGVAAGNSNNALIRHSVISGNGTGLEADTSGQITVDDSAISGNGTGVQATGSNIRLSNSDISFNTTQAFLGTPISYGNNRVFGNTAGGTGVAGAPGGPSSNIGEQ